MPSCPTCGRWSSNADMEMHGASSARTEERRAETALIEAYEAILTEMRTHARASGLIANWVLRLDQERDVAARAGVQAVVSPQLPHQERSE